MRIKFTPSINCQMQDCEPISFQGAQSNSFRVLVINTGSTSTKIAVYQDDEPIIEQTLAHSTEELSRFGNVVEQLEWRQQIILDKLAAENIAMDSLSAVIGRGGLLRPVKSGVYRVNQKMIDELHCCTPQHASNLSAIIAASIADKCQISAYIADPIVVDERAKVAKICGIKQIRSRCIFHALNQKATARIYADEIGECYENLNLVVAHMGGGISVAAHEKGVVVDVNNALDGEGPIAPERAGTLPAGALVDMCFSGEYTHQQINSMIVGKAGLVSLTGCNSVKELCDKAQAGDAEAEMAIEAMCYTTAKQIGAMATVLKGNVDAILLTGGITNSKFIVEQVSGYCRYIAPIRVYPGENELMALAMNAMRVLRGQTQAQDY